MWAMLRPSSTLFASLTLAAAVGAALLTSPSTARADTTLGFALGGVALERDGATSLHPTLHAQLTLELLGPLEVGGFVAGVGEELPLSHVSLAGGLVLLLRAQRPVLGLVPHLEASVARLQLPSEAQGRVDGWSTAVGVGVGVPLDDGLRLEVRFTHSWFHGLPEAADVGDTAWTGTAGLSVDL